MAEDGGIARGGSQQVEQDSDRGRFAGAVQTEEYKDFARWYLEVKMIYSDEAAVAFCQSSDGDR